MYFLKMLIFIWKATKHDVFECVCRWWSGLVLQSLAEKWELAEALQTPLNSIAREMIFWKRRRFSSLMGLIFKTWNCMLCQKKILGKNVWNVTQLLARSLDPRADCSLMLLFWEKNDDDVLRLSTTVEVETLKHLPIAIPPWTRWNKKLMKNVMQIGRLMNNN